MNNVNLSQRIVGLSILLLIAFLTQQSNFTRAETPTGIYVDGVISRDTVWTAAQSPYFLEGDVTLSSGATLTIEPGVTVQQMVDARSLIIQGHLEAIGTADAPIVFTSDEDSGQEQWRGIIFDNSTGHLNHVIVRHGGQNGSPGIHIRSVPQNGLVLVENSILRQNGGYGIQVNPATLHRTQFGGNIFERNQPGNGVAIESGTISDDTTLFAPGTPSAYLLLSDVFVNADVTLTIEPDIMVQQVQNARSLTIRGTLNAIGTADAPIIFTSNEDSNPEQWRGIIFDNGAGHLSNVIVRHGGQNGTPGIHIQSVQRGEQVLVEESTFEQNAGYGIQVRSSTLHQVKFGNNTFRRNALGNGVAIESGDIDNSATLFAPGTPSAYFLGGDVFVNDEVTLTIEPGIMMQQVQGIRSLFVRGTLNAIGTVDAPIIFTSGEDSDSEQWRGIVFDNGAGHLSNVIVRHGGQNETPSIHIQNVQRDAQVLIEESQFEQNGGYAIQVRPSTLHQVKFGNNTFRRNEFGNGVAIESGDIDNSATLFAPGTPAAYFLGGDISVGDDVTLTVEPGVMVQQTQGIRSLTVRGSLNAIGTANAPIIFTSDEDSDSEQWRSIRFEDGTGQLSHVIVRHGGQNSAPSVALNNSQVTIECSQFIDNGGDGIRVQGTSSQLTLAKTTLQNNRQNGLYNESNVQIDARNTWWGAADGPGGIGPGSGDAVQGDVLFDPWLTSAPTADCEQPSNTTPAPTSVAATATPTPMPQITPTTIGTTRMPTITPMPTTTSIPPTATLVPTTAPSETATPEETAQPTSTPRPNCCVVNVIFFGDCNAGLNYLSSTSTEMMPLHSEQTENPVDVYTHFRDETLRSSDAGQGYIDFYEKHTDELVEILAEDAELSDRVEQFLVDAADEFASLETDAEGGLILEQALVDEADALVVELSSAGSAEFSREIGAVWQELVLDEKVGQETRAVWEDVQQREGSILGGVKIYLPLIEK